MHKMAFINYLDNGATSFPKPSAVVREVQKCMTEYCGNPGRGSHRMALTASEKLYEARSLITRLVSAPAEDRVAFTLNATYAINMAMTGLIKKGTHILISDLEHNSVLRPAEHLKRISGVSYDVFSTKGDVCENISRLLRRDTSVLVCTHASNITNKTLPIEKIGDMLRGTGILFMVDASQSAGSRKINMESAGIDVLCAPAHKGLLGPQGIGFAAFSERAVPSPFVYGGSGAHSRELDMPPFLPDRLEAGTLPTPAAAGLCEGIKFILDMGEDKIFERECDVIHRISKVFENDRRISVYSEGEGSIWLFNIRGVPSQVTAKLLDREGVCVRPGLHCAPLAHKTLGTPEDGAVRVSAGPLTEMWQAEHFNASLKRVLAVL